MTSTVGKDGMSSAGATIRNGRPGARRADAARVAGP